MPHSQSGQQTEEVLKRMADAYYEVDDEWRVAYWNAAMERRAGYHQWILGQTLWEAVPALLETEFETNYRLAMTTREPISFEAVLTAADYRVSVDAFPSETGLAIYSRETTVQREQERRLAAVFDNTFQFMALLRPSGMLLEVNEGLLEVTDLHRDDLVDRMLGDLRVNPPMQPAHAFVIEMFEAASAGELVREELDTGRAVYRRILEERYAVHVAHDGRTALNLLRNGIDVVCSTGCSRGCRATRCSRRFESVGTTAAWRW